MSDVMGGGATAPAERGSVPIDSGAAPSAQPLGSQTPVAEKAPAPEAADKPSTTSREALDKAFEKVKGASGTDPKTPAEKTAPKVEAKATPEAKTDAKPATEPPRADPQRGNDGRFARTEAEQNRQPQPDNGHASSPFREAPQRFDDAAKAEWERAPEAIKGAVHRTIRELEQGHQKYRADAEAYSELREFTDMAKKQGVTIKDALTHYTGIEKLLRQDPVGGLERIISNMRLQGADGRQLTLRDIAGHVLNQKPEEQAARTHSTIQAMANEINSLKAQLGGVTQTIEGQRRETLVGQVSAFAKDHPRLDELAKDITLFLESGRATDLHEAYQLAERLNPAPVGPSVREPVIPASDTALAQTQTPPRQPNPAGGKSISGAPSAGSDPEPRKGPVPTTRQALDAAFARAGLG